MLLTETGFLCTCQVVSPVSTGWWFGRLARFVQKLGSGRSMARFLSIIDNEFFFFIAHRLGLDSDVTSAPKGANLNHKRLTTVFINQPFGNGWG